MIKKIYKMSVRFPRLIGYWPNWYYKPEFNRDTKLEADKLAYDWKGMAFENIEVKCEVEEVK